MLKALIKSRFSALFASLTQGSKKSKRKKRVSPVLLGVLFAFLIVYFLFAVGMMFYGFCLMGKDTNEPWIVFAISTIASLALCIFGSIFATKTQIFESKDNELLLSMPIPPKYIFLSRMIALLLVNYLLEAIIMLPCMLMYGIVIGYNPLGFVFAVLIFLLVPFLSLALSSLVAWLISEIASRMKNKTLVTVALFVIFFAGYMYLCFSFGAFAGSGEMENVDFSGLKNSFIFWWAADAISNASPLSMLWFALCAIAPSVIVYIILDKSFIRIITTKRTTAKVEYKGNTEKSSGIRVSLLKKELRRFFSSSAYIMNAGIGNVFSVIIAIVVAVNAHKLNDLLMLPELSDMKELVSRFIPIVIAGVCSFISSMNMVSAPSISLENKSLWILQVSPIKPKDILMSKLLCHMVICLPLNIISVVIASIALKVSVLSAVLIVAVTVGMIAFTGYWGMLLGLKFPKFDWQNENVAVKQGFAVFGTMFGSMLYAIIIVLLGVLGTLVSPYLGLLLMVLPSAIICGVIHAYLSNGGVRDFENLKK